MSIGVVQGKLHGKSLAKTLTKWKKLNCFYWSLQQFLKNSNGAKYFSSDIKFYHQSISFGLKCDNQMFSISPFLDWHAAD